MADRAHDTIEQIAVELTTNRINRDRAWAEFTLVTVITLIGIPSLSYKLGLAGQTISLTVALLWVMIGLILRRTILQQRELDGLLLECDEARAVGLLFESLPYAGGKHKTAIRSALKQMLPMIRDRHTHEFTWNQRSLMRKALLYGGDDELSLAILKCYETTGGRFERELVLMLADGILTRTRDRRIQQAARECLHVMDPHYRELEDDQDLLRASADPEFKLLRPTVATPFAADHLMRPVE